MKTNNISDLAPKRNLIQRFKDSWTEPKPTDEEIKVNKMMTLLFDDQQTEKVIDTLLLFEEKAKARLKEINKQANTDRFVTEYYLETSPEKLTIKI